MTGLDHPSLGLLFGCDSFRAGYFITFLYQIFFVEKDIIISISSNTICSPYDI